MKSGSWWKLSVVGLVAVVSGCGPKLTIEDMKQMRPQRPAALDQLNAFAGSWTTEGTANFIGMDETMKVSGSSKTEWQGDKWYLVESSEFRMEGMDPVKANATWVYDENRNKFRTFYADSMGGLGTGTVKYNERKGIWKMKACGSGPMGSMKGFGTLEFLDDNTMQWCWKEYARWDVFHLLKIVEMRGTSKRG